MAAALALTIMGSLDIFEDNLKPDSLTHWKAGVALIVVIWGFQIFWALFSLLHFQGKKDAPGYRGGNAVSVSISARYSAWWLMMPLPIAPPGRPHRACLHRNPCYLQHYYGRYSSQGSQPYPRDNCSACGPLIPPGGVDSRNDDLRGTPDKAYRAD